MRSHPRTITAALASFAAATVLCAVMMVPAEAATGIYANCTAYHVKYKHGVGRANAHDKVTGKSKPVTTFLHNTALYNAAIAHNKDLDRDKDGVACEKA